jgi:hypothetical protein
MKRLARRRWVLLNVMVLGGALAATAPTATAATPVPGPYFGAPFAVRVNSHTFGQDPAWTRGGEILSQELDGSGILQVYRSELDGSHGHCLTCGRTRGPNGFAEERPQGDWILFCSFGDQPVHFGMPCLGGYGGDLYVMHPNGTDVTRLTRASDPNDGAPYGADSGIPYDNYHPYWSPNGHHLAWVRTEAYPLSAGGQRWEIMLADFVTSRHGAPHLSNVRVVGPAYGVYETQQWAPDGSGFLFTAFGPRESPYQATPPGWMHLELYYMRVFGRGASPAHPRVTQITDDTPVYEEQAVFTPDMRDVIFMSNRNSPYGSWYDEVIAAAQRTKFDAPDPGATGTPQFLADFSDPNFRSDLFMVDVRTHDLRELTDFHNVVPEFNWNAKYTRLIWSGVVGGANHNFITRVARFPTLTAVPRTPTAIPAPGLYGRPIDMHRVSTAARANSQPLGAMRAVTAAVGTPIGTTGKDTQTIPSVVFTYYTLWLSQLKQLGSDAGLDIGAPALLAADNGL